MEKIGSVKTRDTEQSPRNKNHTNGTAWVTHGKASVSRVADLGSIPAFPGIDSLSKKKWKQQHPNYNQSDSLHKLNRTEQVILFRLRTGHNRLNAHMYNKFKVGESEMCPCNADIMTAEHLL